MQQSSTYFTNHLDQISSNPSSEKVEDQAEELMNSLFSELEQTLAIKTSHNSIQASNIDHSANQFSSALSKANHRVSELVIALPKKETRKQPNRETKPDSLNSAPQNTAKSDESQGFSLGFLDSLLLGSALTSAIFALALAFVNLKTTFTPTQAQIFEPSASDSSATTAESLRRSLAQIPEKSTNSTSNASSQSTANGTNGIVDTTGASPVKPIYIPIYQPPAPTVNSNSAPTATPVAPPVVNVPTLAKSAPSGRYTLIGILDLGDRSSAMFDIDGSIQSVKIGNVVGDSGWSVRSISQQEVILKKGREDTTVTVGQKF